MNSNQKYVLGEVDGITYTYNRKDKILSLSEPLPKVLMNRYNIEELESIDKDNYTYYIVSDACEIEYLINKVIEFRKNTRVYVSDYIGIDKATDFGKYKAEYKGTDKLPFFKKFKYAWSWKIIGLHLITIAGLLTSTFPAYLFILVLHCITYSKALESTQLYKDIQLSKKYKIRSIADKWWEDIQWNNKNLVNILWYCPFSNIFKTVEIDEELLEYLIENKYVEVKDWEDIK